MKQQLAPLRTVSHVLGMQDLHGHVDDILDTALRFKRTTEQSLAGKHIALVFEMPSTRTRMSFQVGIQRMGGQSVVMDSQSSQMGRGEPIEDTAAVLGRYVDAIVVRTHDHDTVKEMAKHSGVPVINALTNQEHPCQIMADWMTLLEHKGRLRGLSFAYVGDGNNMCNSYLLGAAMMGMHVRIATPAAYTPDADVVEAAEVLANQNGGTIWIGHDPIEAVVDADAVATDAWASMGDIDTDQRRKSFKGFTVDERLMQHAKHDALFMHCLPGHWGQEASYSVAHGPRSVIYDQAENRMWVQMAMLHHLLA